MIDPKMEKALNAQIAEEMASAHLYLSMAAWFESENLDGMASWMKKQAAEENAHAMRLWKHIADRQGTVLLLALSQPKTVGKSPSEAFNDALAHERHITSKIHELVGLADELKDYAARAMLDWFVNEQVEEEEQTARVTAYLDRLGDSPSGLTMLDVQLGKRQ